MDYNGIMAETAATPRGGPNSRVRTSDIVIDDTALSMRAKGVFVTLGLLGGSSTLAALTRRTSDLRDDIRAAVEELISGGYVNLERERVTIKDPTTFGLDG